MYNRNCLGLQPLPLFLRTELLLSRNAVLSQQCVEELLLRTKKIELLDIANYKAMHSWRVVCTRPDCELRIAWDSFEIMFPMRFLPSISVAFYSC